MSYTPGSYNNITREMSVATQLGEWIDEQQQKGNKQPSIKTIGFEIPKGGSPPMSVPSISPSNPTLLSKSPSTFVIGNHEQRSRSLSSSKTIGGGVSPNTLDVVNNNNKSKNSVENSPISASPNIQSTPTPSIEVTQLTNSMSELNVSTGSSGSNSSSKQQQPQQGGTKQQPQQGGAKQQPSKKEQKNTGISKKERREQQRIEQGGTKPQQPQQQNKKEQGKREISGSGSIPNNSLKSSTASNSSNSSVTSATSSSTVTTVSSTTTTTTTQSTAIPATQSEKKSSKRSVVTLAPSVHHLSLFDHLLQYDRSSISLGVGVNDIHPYIIHLGLKYADFSISGSTARAIAMLIAFRKVVEDFQAPIDRLYSRELDSHLKPNIQFLVDCRPMSISMGNTINYIKFILTSTHQMSHDEARATILDAIDAYVERIQVAHSIIAKNGVSKINDGDVIMTYASSHVVELILKQAQEEGKKFRVIVVDNRPKHEGLALLHRLVKYNIKCTYIMFSAISYIMKEVTKVFVGAYSLLANGNLISRAGTAGVASMAKFYNVPFIVCSETYKFSEKAFLDSICSNQIGKPEDLLQNLGEKDEPCIINAENTKDFKNLKLLTIMYDVTPNELIDMVITEFGMVPPTSIPVILREKRTDIGLN